MIKSFIKNAVFLLIITAIVLYFVLRNDFNNIVEKLLTINPLWLIVAILCYGLYLVFKSWAFHITVREEKADISFKRSLIHNITVQFFNGITPFSTGGQPMECYMLKNQGVRLSKGINVVLQTFIFYQTALVIYGFIAVFLNYYLHFFTKVTLLQHLVLLGFGVNTLVIIVLFIVAYAKKWNGFLLKKIIKIAYRIRLVEDYDACVQKWEERLNCFHECAMHLRENKLLFFKGVGLQFVSLTFFYIVPLFVIYGMGHYSDLNVISAIVSSAYVMIIGSFVPIPGGSGGIEYGFLAIFGNFIGGSLLSAVLLIWRFITYYLGMIVGSVVFSIDKGGKRK